MNDWILTTDHKPEPHTNVLITAKLSDKDNKILGVASRYYNKLIRCYMWADSFEKGYYFDDEIIAWMPLPKVYEGNNA